MERLKKVGQIRPACAKEIGISRLGVGFEKLDRKAFDPRSAYDQVAELGVHYVRLQSGWQRTEREKGVYDFSWLDEIVDNIIARGQEPWIDLCYGNDLYNESARKYYGAVGCAPVSSEEEKQAWERYVEAVAGTAAGSAGMKSGMRRTGSGAGSMGRTPRNTEILPQPPRRRSTGRIRRRRRSAAC